MSKKYTTEELKYFLINFYKTTGKPPKGIDCKSELVPPHECIYFRRFGSWKNALRECNIPIIKYTKPKIPKEYIIDEIKKFYKKYGTNPKLRDMSFSQAAVHGRFGSWRNAIKEAGLTPLTMPQKIFYCKVCNKPILRDRSARNRNKNHFCSYSCASQYNQTWRKTQGLGTHRSKAEEIIENKLRLRFPELNILFNDCKEIGMELDIYIPSLRLAFEINGIFHYSPIFGIDKLARTQKLDSQKIINCIKKNIDLWVIDISNVKQPGKEKYIKTYANKITSIIDSKINSTVR